MFLAPEGDHYRTRLTHTLEVSQIARTIARALRLNENLTEAIALGHDLGHTPFGHSGERVLNEICQDGFAHYRQSVRVVEVLEKDGQGLNLTWEVRDGILNHRTSGHPSTLEGKVVRFSDKIAYINHDIDDAIRARLLTEGELPSRYTDVLGHSVRERLNTMIHDIIVNSMDRPEIAMSPGMEEAMQGLRSWMFEARVHQLGGQGGGWAGGEADYQPVRLLLHTYEGAAAGIPPPDGERGEAGTGGLRLHRRHERRIRHRPV